MALITNAIKGTLDLLPKESCKTQYIEAAVREIAENYGFLEMRTPVFEHTELFQRSVGETTDVVQKEMYTFEDKGGRSITLRPEGTAGAARAFLEHGLFNDALPQKIYYLTSCYRYEKPQAGRLREFHQFGVESFGAGTPAADAEIISLAHAVFRYLGVQNLTLEINSIGCPECRKKFQEALKAYFESYREQLCDTCKSRLERNPMRILDCKSPVCSEIAAGAPKILDFLCDDCRAHFDAVQKYLQAMDIAFTVNPTIVRGLDYYTRTVFEFVSSEIGAQGTVCGGGRYDGLLEELGGKPMPACGFGMGIERLLLLMEAQGVPFPEPKKCDVYLVSMGEEAGLKAAALAEQLREEGLSAQFDTVGRGLKAQMKYADKIGAAYTVVLGDAELESRRVNLKNMRDGTQTELSLDDFVGAFQSIVLREALAALDTSDLDEADISTILGGVQN
ncbi:MAG TPA: histidine--tRNA ligase [Candidatus Fimenecus stercoravium]|nr:histidine--tRNA ligase [Candidatus Fimenecus stercoravium]